MEAQDLKIYNTLTGQKEKFESLEPGRVSMYCCGPTVYDFLHVGNFRGAIFFNLVRNWLEQLGYEVKYVYNYTDVDDKIIKRANDEKTTSAEISERYIQEFEKDYKALGLKPHSRNPRVTEFIKEIQFMIAQLIANGKAYVAKGGEVLYSIKAFDGYGKLSNRNIEDMLAGSRIEVDEKKRDALDFALWKPSKPGEPAWESPWGAGRPGWHIECSAMAKEILGDQIDIHGGGVDLVFPHHENEIAQSEGCTGKAFVKYWMHNNMINFGQQKMSKSLGNIRTGRSFLAEYNAEILKFMILHVHYRSVSDFSQEAIERSVSGLARVYSALAVAESFVGTTVSPIAGGTAAGGGTPAAVADPGFDKVVAEATRGIGQALNDDFNTPEAFASIYDLVRAFNGMVKLGMKPQPLVISRCQKFIEGVRHFGKLASLFQEPAKQYLLTLDDMLLKKKGLVRFEIDVLVAQRWQARQAKDFAKSDELRDQLLKLGIQISDTPTGSCWEVQK